MSVRARTRFAVVAAVVVGLAGATCSPGRSENSSDGKTPWAQDAVELFESIARDLSDVDRHAAAKAFADEGILDLRAWGGDVYSGRLEIAEALGAILYITPRAAFDYQGPPLDLEVHVDQVFVGDGRALVRFDAQHLAGGVPWMQLYAVVGDAVLTSRLYTEDLGHIIPNERWTHEPEHPFYDRYIDVWSSGDPDRLAEVYARTVVVRDEFGGESWHGLDELGGEIASAPPLEHGPWPERFRFDSGIRPERIAVVQLGGSCPALEARRWVFDDGLIVDETRFAHVPSVRRCQGDGGEGWWTDFDATGSEEFGVDTITIGERSIEVVNTDRMQRDLVRWLFGRFGAGSLAQPDVAAFWFPPSVDCGLSEAIARPDDDRFEGRHTVTLCFTPDELSSGWPDRRWSSHVVHQGLHELAHVWMYDRLDDPDRQAFVDRVGLDTWRDTDTFWPERGVEVAAETIAWGLAGTERAQYLIMPPPDCAELTDRYVMLTGQDPLTTCDTDGVG